MMLCIFCNEENIAKSIEHIVSEAFGNKSYVAERGSVCDNCNNNFSRFERVAVSNSIFLMERARLGIATKSGKNAKGKIGNLEIEGHEQFEINKVTINGLTEENFMDHNPETTPRRLYIQSFDKSEVAVSKLLFKMALSAIFKSQRKLYNKYDFSELKQFLLNKNTIDWPFLTSTYEIEKFKSVPGFTDKYNLIKLRCSLKYNEADDQTLLFMFIYGGISMLINLLNRNLKWIEYYHINDPLAAIYPLHYRKKL